MKEILEAGRAKECFQKLSKSKFYKRTLASGSQELPMIILEAGKSQTPTRCFKDESTHRLVSFKGQKGSRDETIVLNISEEGRVGLDPGGSGNHGNRDVTSRGHSSRYCGAQPRIDSFSASSLVSAAEFR
ncbi:hypothetical protein J6590_059781 [Homalodisca vitripennis]|nr:hypothetical protein J6590_059781 [Homalodisca vitripennis]